MVERCKKYVKTCKNHVKREHSRLLPYLVASSMPGSPRRSLAVGASCFLEQTLKLLIPELVRGEELSEELTVATLYEPVLPEKAHSVLHVSLMNGVLR